jgi:hypothetical protein
MTSRVILFNQVSHNSPAIPTAYTKASENCPDWEKLSAAGLGQQEINERKYRDKSEASAAPFPASIAGNDCFHPVLHNLYLQEEL